MDAVFVNVIMDDKFFLLPHAQKTNHSQIGSNWYCSNCIFYPLTLTLPLNLPITENVLHSYI